MEHSSKMYLVPSDVLSRFDTEKFSKLDKEMYDALYSSNEDDVIKWKNYSQILQRYLHAYNENEKPIEINVIEQIKQNEIANVPEPITIEEDESLNLLKKHLPKSIKEKGVRLYNFLKTKPYITWDLTGEVTMNKKKLTQSNIIDLVSTAVRSSSKLSPKCWNDFVTEVNKLNIPKTMLGKNIINYKPATIVNLSSSPQPSTSKGKVSVVKEKRQTTRFNPLSTWKKYKL
jgi:hypothetical protein